MTAPPPDFVPIWPGFGLIVSAHCLGAMNLLAVLACSPLIAADMGLSAVEIGLIASAYSAALGTLSIPAGRLADLIGVRTSLFVAAMITAAGAMVIATGDSFAVTLGGILLCGAGYSLVNPAAGRAVLLWYPPDRRGTLMGIKQTGVPLGGAIGTSSAMLAPALGWQVVIGGIGGITAICGVLFLMLPRDQSTRTVARMTLRDEFAAIGRLFRNPVLGRINLASGLTNGGQFILWSYLTEFLRMGAGFGLPLANACLSILHISSIGGRIFWGWLSDRAMGGDSRITLLLVAGIATLGLLGVALVTPANAVLLAPLLAVVLGVTICSATGVQMALTIQTAQPAQAGGAIGYNMLATNIGGVIAPPAFGLVLELSGSFALSWLLAATGVALAFGLLWMDRRVKQ
ncbi:MFS transporter [Roseinatronobacter sp. S2]|uniref:MFS transporter n=1 Tax=Roseinatronobacter sp. S2 TaxID=3035471 RepID=UPI0024102F51|nr:MFS transporter [Roseinatronobacter sp. S2]WFE74693.1 MFS transporter [Roseinatronobacter sp. S2]